MSKRYEHGAEPVGPGYPLGGLCGICEQTAVVINGKNDKTWRIWMCPRCDVYPPAPVGA